MAVEFSPIELNGNWDLGFALDKHVIRSIPIGEDPFGGVCFDTERSQIGELIYQFKYRYKHNNLTEIVDTILEFFKMHPEMNDFETIIPVPPTKTRMYQPTFEIGQALADELKVYCLTDILENTSSVESKALSSGDKHKLKGAIIKKKSATRRHSVLVLDDVYKTGTTLRECVKVLREDSNIEKIYVLTMTKTKNG